MNNDDLHSRGEPEEFFRRATDRLLHAPIGGDAEAVGDHILNPQFASADSVKYRDAAVLIRVIARRPHASVLLTERTPDLSTHAGQIAFPGGKIDAGDSGPADAALREAEEEIGLAPDNAEVIGYLDTYLSRTGYRIVPVLAKVSPDFSVRINRREVADVFEVPMPFLLDPANHRRANRDLGAMRAHFYEITFEGRYIWGVTAGIIRTLYNRMAD